MLNSFFYPALIRPMSLSPSVQTDSISLHLLSTFLTRLKTTIESELGHCIANAPTSTIIPPSFWSLARSGALGTDFATADMHLLRVSQGEQQFIAAAWAGMGYDAEGSQTAKRTLAISFTPTSLTVTTANIRSSQDISHLQSVTYPQLGFSQKDTFNGGYWEAIKGVMMSAAHRGGGAVERVLIIGETAGEKGFLDALWWVLGELGVQGVYGELQVAGFDAERVLSKGMAELALRRAV